MPDQEVTNRQMFSYSSHIAPYSRDGLESWQSEFARANSVVRGTNIVSQHLHLTISARRANTCARRSAGWPNAAGTDAERSFADIQRLQVKQLVDRAVVVLLPEKIEAR